MGSGVYERYHGVRKESMSGYNALCNDECYHVSSSGVKSIAKVAQSWYNIANGCQKSGSGAYPLQLTSFHPGLGPQTQ